MALEIQVLALESFEQAQKFGRVKPLAGIISSKVT
jgi:hypothetical protein